MGLQHFQGIGPPALLWARLRAALEKILVNDIPKHLHYCVICIAYKQFANVATRRIIRPGGLRVEDPCSAPTMSG